MPSVTSTTWLRPWAPSSVPPAARSAAAIGVWPNGSSPARISVNACRSAALIGPSDRLTSTAWHSAATSWP